MITRRTFFKYCGLGAIGAAVAGMVKSEGPDTVDIPPMDTSGPVYMRWVKFVDATDNLDAKLFAYYPDGRIEVIDSVSAQS